MWLGRDAPPTKHFGGWYAWYNKQRDFLCFSWEQGTTYFEARANVARICKLDPQSIYAKEGDYCMVVHRANTLP